MDFLRAYAYDRRYGGGRGDERRFETAADLKPLLMQLLSKVDTVLDAQNALADAQQTLVDAHKTLADGQQALADGQKRIEGDVREMKGQLSILTVWMQSIDQRFMTLMAPVNPPRKLAAE